MSYKLSTGRKCALCSKKSFIFFTRQSPEYYPKCIIAVLFLCSLWSAGVCAQPLTHRRRFFPSCFFYCAIASVDLNWGARGLQFFRRLPGGLLCDLSDESSKCSPRSFWWAVSPDEVRHRFKCFFHLWILTHTLVHWSPIALFLFLFFSKKTFLTPFGNDRHVMALLLFLPISDFQMAEFVEQTCMQGEFTAPKRSMEKFG